MIGWRGLNAALALLRENETQLDGAHERVILWILLLSELIKTIH